MPRLLRLAGHAAVQFLENSLTAYHDRWLNLSYFWPVSSLD
jgi:hypothetical protein